MTCGTLLSISITSATNGLGSWQKNRISDSYFVWPDQGEDLLAEWTGLASLRSGNGHSSAVIRLECYLLVGVSSVSKLGQFSSSWWWQGVRTTARVPSGSHCPTTAGVNAANSTDTVAAVIFIMRNAKLKLKVKLIRLKDSEGLKGRLSSL